LSYNKPIPATGLIFICLKVDCVNQLFQSLLKIFRFLAIRVAINFIDFAVAESS